MGFFLSRLLRLPYVLDSSQITFLIIGSIALLALLTIFLQQYFNPKQRYFSKKVITAFESKMFFRLKEAFPQHHVLAQVAFSALITNSNLKIRARFNRKVTDFVLLDKRLNVVMIIELDDPSHIGKEVEDAQRDAMLYEAGYRVKRYIEIPTVETLKKDIP